MSPVSTNGVDKQGVYVNGVQVKQALQAANETVEQGVYDATTLSTVDADLAGGNIKNGITLFGFAGSADVHDISDATAIEAEVITGETFYAVGGGIRTGTMPIVAIVAANDNYPAGYHAGDAGGLDAIDADLAPGNIKLGVDIFGKVGTVIEGGVETIEMYAEGNLATTQFYVPSHEGIYFTGKATQLGWQVQYQDGGTVWRPTVSGAFSCTTISAISDGSRFKLYRQGAAAADYQLMRHYMSTGTYERASSADLASLATYTPSEGFVAVGVELVSVYIQQDLPTEGWVRAYENPHQTGYAVALVITDGAEIRVLNSDGANARWYALMRAVMT